MCNSGVAENKSKLALDCLYQTTTKGKDAVAIAITTPPSVYRDAMTGLLCFLEARPRTLEYTRSRYLILAKSASELAVEKQCHTGKHFIWNFGRRCLCDSAVLFTYVTLNLDQMITAALSDGFISSIQAPAAADAAK